MNPSFGVINYTVLIVYLLAMFAIGAWLARKQNSADMFFLGGRKLPWLAVAMSMYASLTSAVTYLGLPGTAYGENVSLIIVCIMSPVVAPFILWLFYPFYDRLKVTTSYEYILRRFGSNARFAVAGLFILARLGWLGTVVYAPSMALSVVTGIPLYQCILGMGLLATAYTALGGLSAVVWTDVVQFVILVGGAIWVAVTLITQVDGGAMAILRHAAAEGHLKIADWHINLFVMSGPVVAVSFFFQLMQDYGTDQVTVQRLQSIGHFRGIVKAVVFNAVTDLVIIALLLFIGLGLLAFYARHPDWIPPDSTPDKVLPYFIIHQLPMGISGLVITGVFAAAMSSMDSGINSLATVLVNDFIQPVHPVSSCDEVKWARILTLMLGIIATATAFYVSQIGGIIAAFASFMGLFSAPVLALFLLGILTRYGQFQAWLYGLAVSVSVTFAVQRLTAVHWVYYFPLSFLLCFGISLAISRKMHRPPVSRELTLHRNRT